MDEADLLSEIAAQRAKEYKVFIFTTDELTALLWTFTSHMNAISELPPEVLSEQHTQLINNAINEVLEKLAASLAEGMTIREAVDECYPPITPSELPPEVIRAWWRGWRRGRERMAVRRNMYGGGVQLVPESATGISGKWQRKGRRKE
jgi:hypothetical protein